MHTHLELASPSAPEDFEVSPVDWKCFPRLAFQICKTFPGMFPKVQGFVNPQDGWYSGEASLGRL